MNAHLITGGGIKQQGRQKYHQPLPEFKGRHLWAFFGVWRVDNPAASHQNFDIENLVTVEGPGCLWCEEQWIPTIGSKCPGEPKENQ